MSAVKPKAFDPLNRIEPEGKLSYAHPAISEQAMEDYWRRYYAEEAAALPADALAQEHEFALLVLAGCEKALESANSLCDDLQAAIGAAGDREIEWHAAASEREAVRCRMARRIGRRDAIVAELARRGRR